MAKSMDTADEGRTWRMGLRDGVKFSDGTPLDAQAVITNVQRHIDKKSSPGHRFTEPITSMRAVDPLTVEFSLSTPFGQFPTAFAQNFTFGGLGMIISPAALARYGDQIVANPVGAGPFVLSSWTRDSKMTLTKNPDYWQKDKGLPRLDGLEFRPLPDTETRYASIENGDVDLIFGGYHTELLRGMENPNLFDASPYDTSFTRRTGGITPRTHVAANDYLIDRDVQRNVTFTGVSDFVSQDMMVSESMGPIVDRSDEQLGQLDKAVIRMRRLLIGSAKALAADGTEPPALAGDGRDFTAIRAADKTLEPGEDWRYLGTDDDPAVQEALDHLAGERQPVAGD